MENLTLGGIGAGILVIWYKAKAFWSFWSPVIEEIVKIIEEKARDGVIDKHDRKAIALKTVDLIAKKKGKKVGFIGRYIISWLIDKYAGKLPPISININDIIEEVK